MRRIIKYDINKRAFIFKFKYDANIIYNIKTKFKYRKWNPEDRVWEVRDSLDKIKLFANDFDFKINISNYKKIKGKRYITIVDDHKITFHFIEDKNKENEFSTELEKYFNPILYDNQTYTVFVNKVDNSVGTLENAIKIADKFGFKYDKELLNSLDHYTIDFKKYDKILMPFQKESVKEIIKKGSILNADDMGLGKTLQTIAAIDIANWYPVLIVSPATLKLNWAEEYHKWCNDREVSVWSKKNTDFKDVNIINYDILDKYIDKLLKHNIKTLVLDESHYIKNPKAKRTKAAKKISKKVTHRILLSGTPINNKPAELWSQIEILGYAPFFNNKYSFYYKYCDAHKDNWGHLIISGHSNLLELHNKLKIAGFIRRKKTDVLTELPKKTINIIPVELSNMRKYKKAEKELINYIKETALNDKEYYKTLEGMSEEEKQIEMKKYSEIKAMKAIKAEQLVRYEALKQLTVELKENYIWEWIDNFIETTNEKLIIFGKHNSIIDKIINRYNCIYIKGGMSDNQKMKYKNDFQSDNMVNEQGQNTRIIVINIDAGKEGLTLTKSSTVLFVELGWTPLELMQAEDRTHRIGQEKNVNVYYLIGKNSIEEDILDIINPKRLIMDQILDGEKISSSTNDILDEMNKKIKNKLI